MPLSGPDAPIRVDQSHHISMASLAYIRNVAYQETTKRYSAAAYLIHHSSLFKTLLFRPNSPFKTILFCSRLYCHETETTSLIRALVSP